MLNHSKNVSLHNTLRNYIKQNTNTYIRHTFFCHFKSFIRFHLAFGFGLETFFSIEFSKIHQLKGLKPKNKG